MNIENATVKTDTLKNVVQNIEYNKKILEYYDKFENENRAKIKLKNLEYDDLKQKQLKNKTLKNKIKSIEKCNKFWELEKYEKLKVKDFISTSLCKDKFCANCKKVKQASRISKYTPELEKYSNQLYHLTLTQPNVPGKDLKKTIKKMAKSFRHLNLILKGVVNIKGLDFSYLQYQGALRSLEVTFLSDDYHPHYHSALVLNNLNAVKEKKNINNYSYDYSSGKKVLKTKFSDLEVLIQKIWYLLMNDIVVTKKRIDNLELGYSCRIDKLLKDDYKEFFKYMTKELDEQGNVLTYGNFKMLYGALYRVKQIQGYGCLYQITDTLDVETIESEYNDFIEQLKKIEAPATVFEQPSELLNNYTDYKLISRKSYMKHLNHLMSQVQSTK